MKFDPEPDPAQDSHACIQRKRSGKLYRGRNPQTRIILMHTHTLLRLGF